MKHSDLLKQAFSGARAAAVVAIFVLAGPVACWAQDAPVAQMESPVTENKPLEIPAAPVSPVGIPVSPVEGSQPAALAMPEAVQAIPAPAETLPAAAVEAQPVAVVPSTDTPPVAAVEESKPSVPLPDTIETLSKRVTALEETVGQLQQKAVESAVADKKNPADEAVKKPAAKPHKKKAVRKKIAPPPEWVLKSAKPGMAWVAKKGSTDLQAVAVGDVLEGVGQVTAIVKDSAGLWAVSGTKGRINQ